MTDVLLASKTVIREPEPTAQPIVGVPTAVVAAIGITEKGPIGVPTLVMSWDQFVATFGREIANGDLAHAARGFFDNGGQMMYVTRTVHYTDVTNPSTKTSAKATINVQTAALGPTAGSVLGSVVGPFNLEPGDTLVGSVDGLGNQTATITATAAARASGADTFALVNNQTLTVRIDGGVEQSIVFLTGEFVDIANATAEEVSAVINAKIVGASATNDGSVVTITSDRRGSGSGVNVTGGTANGALGFTTGNIAGTGNVSNVESVSVAEIKTIVEAAWTNGSGVTVSNDGGRVRITSDTTGVGSSVLVVASSTADDELGLDNATHSGSAGGAVNTLRVDGKWDGAYGNALSVVVSAASSGEAARFNLSVVRDGVTIEVFPNLSMTDTDASYVETVINDTDNGSEYIAVADLDAALSSPDDRPANATVGPLTGGSDGLSSLDDNDFIGSSAGPTGLYTFDETQELSLLIIPGRATSAVQNAMLTYCEVTRSRSIFAIFDPPANQTAAQMVTYVETTASLLEQSEFGAIYWPRVKVANPNRAIFGTGATVTVPPSGHIAGVYARTDALKDNHGVFQPPAGVERGILRNVLGFETDEVLNETKRDLIYPKRINPLSKEGKNPRCIDGTRTLRSTGHFPTVAERRGVIFIEQSIKLGMPWVRHSNNDNALRARCDRAVRDFMLEQMKYDAFRSKDPDLAFFVDYDIKGESLNTPDQVFANKVNGRVGVATQKPADWHILEFTQYTKDLDESRAA